ncbi:N-acetylmuramic acid 6-phosphate etherase [Clostridiaceae bacterium HSG29]|nr:N-acetylmuramic acid 6-phosphate etherase [Clostridiaceae bacterium HSG29]
MLENIMTEKRNAKSEMIDELDSYQLVKLINDEDKKVSQAVEKELAYISKAVNEISKALSNNGRLFYIGAGTSGRLGVLDASECPPTYGTNPNQIIGIIAGGDHALRYAVEDAEDNFEKGKDELEKYNINESDVIVGIAASGRTPYVLGAIEYAKIIGAKTVGVNCSKGSELDKTTDIPITVDVGPEIVTGSTRMKSGTAQKMVLNMLTTAAMIINGKVYKNLMVDVVPTNKKLRLRQINIVAEASEVNETEAEKALIECNYNTKVAIVSLITGKNSKESEDMLNGSNGHIKKALNKK